MSVGTKFDLESVSALRFCKCLIDCRSTVDTTTRIELAQFLIGSITATLGR